MIKNRFRMTYLMVYQEAFQDLIKPIGDLELHCCLKGNEDFRVTFEDNEHWSAKITWKVGTSRQGSIWVKDTEVKSFVDTLRDLLSRLKTNDLTLPEPGIWDYENGSLKRGGRGAPLPNVNFEPVMERVGTSVGELDEALQELGQAFQGQPLTQETLDALHRRISEISESLHREVGTDYSLTTTTTGTDGSVVREEWSSGTDGGDFS